MSSSSVIDIQLRIQQEMEERARIELARQAADLHATLTRLEDDVSSFNRQHAPIVGRIEMRPFARRDPERLGSLTATRDYVESLSRHQQALRDDLAHRRGLAVGSAFQAFRNACGPRATADVIRATSPGATAATVTTPQPMSEEDGRRITDLVQQHCADDPPVVQQCAAWLAAARRQRVGLGDALTYVEQEIRDSISRRHQSAAQRSRVARLRNELMGLDSVEVRVCRQALDAADTQGRCSADLEQRVHAAAEGARDAAVAEARARAYRVFLQALRSRGHDVDLDRGTRVMVDGGQLIVRKPHDPDLGREHLVEISVDLGNGAVGAHVTRADGARPGAWLAADVRRRFAAAERAWCADLNAAIQAMDDAGIGLSIRPDSFVESQLTQSVRPDSGTARQAAAHDAAAPLARSIDPDRR